MSNLSELLPAGAGAKSAEFVASGAIGNGVPVILNSAGTVTQVSLDTVPTSLGADSDFNGGNEVRNIGGCYDPVTDTQVLIFRNAAVSNYWHIVIGVISGSTTVWGTPVQVKASSNSSNPASVCSIGGGKVIATYLDASGYQYARCGTITAATKTIVFGTEITLFSTATYMTAQALAYSSVRNATACVVNRYGYAFVYRLTVSGTTITADLLDNTGNSTLNGQAQLVNIPGTDAFMIASRYTSGANKFGIGRTFTLSASAWSMATVSLSFSSTVESNVTLAYDSSIDRYVVTWQDSAANYVFYCVGAPGANPSSDQMTWGTATVLVSSTSTVYADYLSTSYNTVQDRVITLHKLNSNNYLYYSVGEVGASTVTWAAPVAYSAANANYPTIYYDSTAERNILARAKPADGTSTNSDGMANVMTVAGDYPNLTATNFLGISDAAISDTATGAVIVQGGVSEKLSGLTVGADYYVQADGSLSSEVQYAPYDISSASFVQSFSVAAQDSIPRDVVFNSDGTKMFILGDAGNKVHQYALSTGFDVSTASFVQSLDISNEGTSPEGLAFNADGTKMFVSDVSVDAVNQYALSTGFDISTASFSQSFSVSGQDTVPTNIAFNTDGTKMFILGDAGNDVNEYSLTTGFDISTASFVDSFSVAAQETSPNGLVFNSDGTKMFVVGFISDIVFQYNLTTGFDVSTASYSSISFNVASQDGNPTGIAFNTDGTKMFIVGYQTDSVGEYTTTALPFSTTVPAGRALSTTSILLEG